MKWTLCKFRRLLEANGLNKLFFDAINRVMVKTGHMMEGGTIVGATIINAPSSTKNAEKARDPEMHQTKKRKEWRFVIMSLCAARSNTHHSESLSAGLAARKRFTVD